MREILFRGKRTDNGEWLIGHYTEHKGVAQIWVASDNGQWNYLVDPNTVDQFTGLTDKNGKKIFEGDVLSTENGTFSNTGMGRILCHKGMWTSYYGQDALGRDCFDELYTVCESRAVIGNIYDNPELLGGGNDGT